MRPRVKICCISSIQEAHLVNLYGGNAIGLVGPMPSGPGVISNAKIREIATATPSELESFLLTSETSEDSVIAHYHKTKTNTIQLVDILEGLNYKGIKEALPQVRLIQVIHVQDKESVALAKKVAGKGVDGILLDSGNPNLKVKEFGGTGRTHNWALSKKIVESVTVPVYLAGGLNSENIREAIELVKPQGVDLCSGVRTQGKLDERKLKKFFEAL